MQLHEFSEPTHTSEPPLWFTRGDKVIPTYFRVVEDAPAPRFGDVQWDLNALGRSRNKPYHQAVLDFSYFDESWSTTFKTLLMVLINPADERLQEFHIFMPMKAPKTASLRFTYQAMRDLYSWVLETGRRGNLEQWTQTDVDQYLSFLLGTRPLYAHDNAIRLLRQLMAFGRILPSRLEAELPETKARSSKELKTQPLEPTDFWALLGAAWTYVHHFGPALLDARDRYEQLKSRDQRTSKGKFNKLLDPFLTDEHTWLPLRCTDSKQGKVGEVHWTNLRYLVEERYGVLLPAAGEELLGESVREALQAGKRTRYGFFEVPARSSSQFHKVKDWYPGIDYQVIRKEILHLRTAAYIMIASLSMLRSSELFGLECGCLTTYANAPAIRGRVFKHKASRGEESFWWVSEPVVEAIQIMERFVGDQGPLFKASLKENSAFSASEEIQRFVNWHNEHAESRNLPPIHDTQSTSHRLRRTMSVITAAQPDGEIALGITLKHNSTRALANSVTSGYGAPTPAWAKELKLGQSSANAARLVSEWSKYSAGTSINRGPGAKIFGDKMEEISQSPEVKAEVLDERVLRDLLRDKFVQFSFGTINHCLGDPRKAECLKGLDESVAAQGPIFDACNPVKCHNSVVTEEHMPIWLAEEKELVKLLRDKRMAANHRQNLELELEDVQKITKR